jgi:hypothetical protein
VDCRAYHCNFWDDVNVDEPIQIPCAVTSDPLLYVNEDLWCFI